jgi:O-acetyl-ADP-ribose deacetylase (regulator of RNase III)
MEALMESQILARQKVGQCSLEAVKGDLTEAKVDAIVNAANSHLAHGGGLAGAIVRRGGAIIQQESDRVAPVEVGHAAVTSAGSLPCRWVIHAVGPRWGEGDEEHKLRSAVVSSLNEAKKLGARSVALPAISTGIFGYPKEEGTREIIEEVCTWLRKNPDAGIERVSLTAFDGLTAGLFAKALDEVQSRVEP